MRFSPTLSPICLGPIVLSLICLSLGCNADPRYRRETALLRAEILDLEDRYFITKAQRDAAINELYGRGKTEQAEKILKRSPAERSRFLPGGISEVIYETDPAFYAPHHEPAPAFRHQDGRVIYDNENFDHPHELIFDDFSLPARPDFSPNYRQEGVSRWEQSLDEGNRNLNSENKNAPNRLTNLENASSQRQSDPNRPGVGSSKPDRSQPFHNITHNNSRPSGSISSNRNPADNRQQIKIDLQQSFPQDDPLTGAPGIQILLQEPNGDGRLFKVEPGTLEISLIDPYAPTISQRIGIWKFLPEELELFFDDQAAGILLHLPYQETFPRGEDVLVLIRYRTANGRLLETSGKIPLQEPSQSPSRIQFDHGDDDLITGNRSRASQNKTEAAGNTDQDRPHWRPIR